MDEIFTVIQDPLEREELITTAVDDKEGSTILQEIANNQNESCDIVLNSKLSIDVGLLKFELPFWKDVT